MEANKTSILLLWNKIFWLALPQYSAVLLWFAAHYVFEMEYGYTDVGNFFQDFIFCVGPHKTRKSSYKTITGSIKLLKGMQCFIHVH